MKQPSRQNKHGWLTQLWDGVGELFSVDGSDPDRDVVGVGHFHPVTQHPVPVAGLGHRCPHPVPFDGHLIGGNSGRVEVPEMNIRYLHGGSSCIVRSPGEIGKVINRHGAMT